MTTAAFLAISLIASWWLTWLLATPRVKLKILDMPKPRSLHTHAMPKTGGVAIFSGTFVGAAALIVSARVAPLSALTQAAAQDLHGRDLLTTLMAVAILAGISLWNDHKDLSPALRLFLHSLAVVFVMLAGQLTINGFSVPFFGVVTFGWTTYIFTFLFLLWMTNLYNFMDGMDGFAGGMTLIGFGFLGGLALWQGAAGLAMLALMIAAASVGFLAFNYPPARIFMGDVGAVPLGFLAGALAVKGSRDNVISLWVPVIIFSPFIVDASLVLIRRALTGQRFWEAHCEHYFQRFVLAGWTHRQTVWLEYILMVSSGVVAIFYEKFSDVGHVIVLGSAVLVYSSLIVAVRVVERRNSALRRLRNAG